MFDIEEVKSLVPKGSRNSITPDFVDMLNECGDKDSIMVEAFKDNFVSYMSILQSGKYKISHYVNVVKYVTYKLLGNNNAESWKLTFPDKAAKIEAEGKDISPHVSMFNNNKLVTLIMQQTIVPLYVLNSHMRQDAVDQLYGIVMGDKVSNKDKINACTALLEAVKQPEDSSLSISVDFKNNDMLENINSSLEKLATQQLELLHTGKLSAREIIEADIIDVGATDE